MNRTDEETIDLLELAKALWKNILLIALVAVLAGSAAFGITAFMMEPQYEATASLYVNNSDFHLGTTSFSISSGDLNASNSLVSVYMYILKSRTTMEEVIQEAGLEYNPTDLAEMVTTKAVSGTGAFEVTVTSSNPAESELIANTIARILPDRIAEIVDGSSVRIVDYAIIPARRSGPSMIKNTALGILLGTVLASAIVVVRFLLDDTSNTMIKSVDELRLMYPDLMVLAMIPDMRVSEKKSAYYYSYYGDPKTQKRGGRNNGRNQRA